MFRLASCLLALGLLSASAFGRAHAQVVVSPARTLTSDECADQDDMCFWLHPTDLSRSTVIVSDKEARRLFVYDLQGKLLQSLPVPKPGNIDLRYNFPLGGERVDIAAFNDRKTEKIRVYKVDRTTRLLARVDDDSIVTGPNYGFTLYRSPKTGRTYAFTGPPEETVVRQWELVDNGAGRISAVGPLRHLRPGGIVEGMVADDETGMLFMSEESGGVWKYSAEASGATSGNRIATVREHGLTHDVEGITLYHRAGGAGYLIVSSQGSNEFKVYDRKPPHGYLGTFSVKGTAETDGCDVIELPLDTTFSAGAFVCHNGTKRPHPDELVKWSDIAKGLGLDTDTRYWDPRRAGLGDSGQRAPAARMFVVPGR